MMKINEQKGRAMLNWGGIVLGETLTSYESLKDGRVLCRMLSIAQRSIDDDSDLADEDESSVSLLLAHNILSTMFAEKVMEGLSLDLAVAGNELELAKFLLLVLAAGVKSPLGRCFMSPSFTLDVHSQNLIMSVMEQAFKGCATLKQLPRNFYDGLLEEKNNQTIESPQDASTPITPKARRNISVMSPAGSVAAACGSPSIPDKSLDKSITTMLKMRQHRICQFEQKLAKEKLLRNEIEAELQLKDDMLESKIDRIKELEQKLASVDKLISKMKNEQSSYCNELLEFKKSSQEQYIELQTRYESACKDLQDSKVRSEYLEKDNAGLYEELHELRKLQTKLDLYKDLEEALTKSNSENSEFRTKEAEYKAHLEELERELQCLKSTLHNERECYREKMNSLQNQNERTWLPESAECLGDILQNDLKENINELQVQLQEMEWASKKQEEVFFATNSALKNEIKDLLSEKMLLNEKVNGCEARIDCLLEESRIAISKYGNLEVSKAFLETHLKEKEDALKCVEAKFECLQIDFQRKVELCKELESKLGILNEEFHRCEQSIEDMKFSETQRLAELQELDSKLASLCQELEVERIEKSKTEEILLALENKYEATVKNSADLTDKLDYLVKENDILKCSNFELQEQIINRSDKIKTLEIDLLTCNERCDKMKEESSNNLKLCTIEISKKEEQIIKMKEEITKLETSLKKVTNDLGGKNVLILKNEASRQELSRDMESLTGQLKDAEDANKNLIAECSALNKEKEEVKARLKDTETCCCQLEIILKSKSEKNFELEERLTLAEQELERERITFIERENALKSDLQKFVEDQEQEKQKCSHLEEMVLEQTGIIQSMKADAEFMKTSMERKVNEAHDNANHIRMLNEDLNKQLDTVLTERKQFTSDHLEREQSLIRELEDLKYENSETTKRLLKQESEMRDLLLQKKISETKLAALENDFKSLQNNSERDNNVLAAHRQLIQKLETKLEDNEKHIQQLMKELKCGKEEFNKEMASLSSRLAVEVNEKKNLHLSLMTMAENNEMLQSSHDQKVSEIKATWDENRKLLQALKAKEEEICVYKQLNNTQEDKVLKERFQIVERENQALDLQLANAKNILHEREMQLNELLNEKRQMNEEVLRSREEVNLLKKEIQENNKKLEGLSEKIAGMESVSKQVVVQEGPPVAPVHHDVVTLSRSSSSRIFTNETRDHSLGHDKRTDLGKEKEKEEVANDQHLLRVNTKQQFYGEIPIDYFHSGLSLEDKRRASDCGRNLSSMHQNFTFAISNNKSNLSIASERRHSSVYGSAWSAASSILLQNANKSEGKENERTVNRIPRGLGVILRNEDEPDHMDWGLLEKHASKKAADSIFGGAKFDSTINTRRTSFSNSNVDISTSRKNSLGTSCTTFSSFHPAKQEAFGLHSIAEDDARIEEIRRRNSLYLPHLKSSYPLEELQQLVPDEELKNPVTTNDENVRPARLSFVRDKRKSPHKKFSFNSTISPSAKRSRAQRSKADTPSKRISGFINAGHSSDGSSLKSEPNSSIISDELNQKKTKGVAYSIGFTPKKALSKLRFNKKKKEDR